MKRMLCLLLILVCCVSVFAVTPVTSAAAASNVKIGRNFDRSIVGARGWALIPIDTHDSDGNAVRLNAGDGFIIKSAYQTENHVDKWKVMWKNCTVYVRCEDCMINLADVFVDLSKASNVTKDTQGVYFNITNNSKNIYEYLEADPKKGNIVVNGQKFTSTPLLPDVRLYDWNKQFVPVYYPTARRIAYAKNYLFANHRNYRLKFYDTFRPVKVSDRLRRALDKVYKNNPAQFAPLSKGWLIAQNMSSHNYGTAIDVTLCSVHGKEDSTWTYSKMHALYGNALSTYSLAQTEEEENKAVYGMVRGRIKLSKGQTKTITMMMRDAFGSAGMSILASEWWHYQDNKTDVREKAGTSIKNNKLPSTLSDPGSLTSATKSKDNKTVVVSWKNTGAVKYRVFRKIGSDSWAKLADVNSNVTSYTDAKAVAGKTYYYTVRSLDKHGNYCSDYHSSNAIKI